MGRLIVNVPVKDVQGDEIWGFVAKKEAHKLPAEEDDDSMGDAYCFVGDRAPYEAGSELRSRPPQSGHHGCLHRRLAPCDLGKQRFKSPPMASSPTLRPSPPR